MEYLPRTYSVLSVAAAEKFHTSLRELLPAGRYSPVRCAMNSAPILHSTSPSNRARGYCYW